jgi:nicotinamide-nucleotide amidase
VFPTDILELAEQVLSAARAKGLKIATAESCTGGLVAGALTAIAGSSDVFERGFVTYSNEAKEQLLGVSPDILGTYGAVSEETAAAMAFGALKGAFADIAVSITGIAGPGGGSAAKPVGLVWFGGAYGRASGFIVASEARFGDLGRAAIREESVRRALGLLQELAQAHEPRP